MADFPWYFDWFFMDIKYKRDAMHSTDPIIANGADIAYPEK